MTTTVIFRKDKRGNFKGDITAVFPYDIANFDYGMTCYAHVGQHSACDHDWYIQETVPAKPDEYKDLLNELVNAVGYDDLEIKQKINSNKFREAMNEMQVRYER